MNESINQDKVKQRVEGILAGDIRTAARLMRELDDGLPSARLVMQKLYPHTGKAFIVGITGNPGSGKSTLSDQLIEYWRKSGHTIGVVAVDPTSPFTGGAILGDRVRMQRHSLDEGVFIRSLATRGHLGGLSRSTLDVVKVLDAMGKDIIIIETVGVGQDEIEVTRAAHSSLVVLVPGLGDDIQAIKAGILEIADIFVVNKADRQGADRTVQDLRSMLDLFRPSSSAASSASIMWTQAPRGVAQSADPDGWAVPILKTVATENTGIEEVSEALFRHREDLQKSGHWDLRERDRAKLEFMEALKERLVMETIHSLENEKGVLDEIISRIANRAADPYTLADETVRK